MILLVKIERQFDIDQKHKILATDKCRKLQMNFVAAFCQTLYSATEMVTFVIFILRPLFYLGCTSH